MKLIVAVDRKWGIGKDNKLLYNIPADKKFFKKMTMNKTVVMGRNTYKSIGGALLGRDNIVITTKYIHNSDRLVFMRLSEFLFRMDILHNTDNYFIIGGEMLYNKMIDKCDELFITHIDSEAEADRFFPDPTKHGFIRGEIIKSGKHNDINYEIVKWIKK